MKLQHFFHTCLVQRSRTYSAQLQCCSAAVMANEFLEADEKLIEAVCEFACLWQVNSKVYKDIIAKENAWKSIGEQV